jgi:hypothetical protein
MATDPEERVGKYSQMPTNELLARILVELELNRDFTQAGIGLLQMEIRPLTQRLESGWIRVGGTVSVVNVEDRDLGTIPLKVASVY